MDSKELAEYIDQHRWLMNNGLVNDGIKNQLFMYGSIVHKEVKAVEVDINVEKRLIHYQLFFDKKMLENLARFKELSTSTGLIGMWRFKRMLKKQGNLHLDRGLKQFIKDYCGPKWNVEIEYLDVAKYVEGYEGGQNPPVDKQPD